jgi:hypothetical protein
MRKGYSVTLSLVKWCESAVLLRRAFDYFMLLFEAVCKDKRVCGISRKYFINFEEVWDSSPRSSTNFLFRYEFWFLCRQYTAQDVYQMGLVNKVVLLDKLQVEVSGVKEC